MFIPLLELGLDEGQINNQLINAYKKIGWLSEDKNISGTVKIWL